MVLEVQQAGPKYFTPDNEVPGPSSRFKRTDKGKCDILLTCAINDVNGFCETHEIAD